MKANKTMKGQAVPNHRRRKERNQRKKLIQLHTIKPSNNKNNYMTGIITYLSILALNVNLLNSPIKRHSLPYWVKKTQQSVDYRRPISLMEASTGLG
jgi:hypothetical protein